MKLVTTHPPPRDVLLYDGHCRLCRAGVTTLSKMSRSSPLELKSFREPGVLEAFPGVSLERCENAMQLVLPNGRVLEGAEAVVQALRHRWFGKLLLLYYLPVIRQLANAAYGLIARYRFRILGRDCPEGTCSIHQR
jgi:predicted DCC family thiol-disulfide oxidoreductase YuxK